MTKQICCRLLFVILNAALLLYTKFVRIIVLGRVAKPM